MNKNLYRIIFSKARNMFIAVGENSKSQTKAAGESAKIAISPRTHASTALHQHWVVKSLVASMSIWLSVAPVYAQIQADPVANTANRPVVGVGKNSQGQNVPVVNIQTPVNGVSHNIYKQMDVLSNGVVLNNSRTGAGSAIVGSVGANPFLAKGEARLILNEINSTAATRFEGNLEVAGQRADVVIANPAGINIKGGGFINANKAIFTTGKAQLNADGSLKQFVVDQGKVTVTANTGSTLGLGGNNNNADYVDIYARALDLNAQLHANQDINVITGVNTVSADLESIESKTSPVAAPALAVDIKSLGGMYANNIYLMGNEKGLGVTNAGTLQAVNNIVVTNTGKIIHSGTISTTDKKNGLVSVAGTGAAADIAISGSVNSYGLINIDSGNNLNLNAKDITLNYDATTLNSAALIIGAQGNLNLATGTKINNLSINGDLYVDAKGISLAANSELRSNRGSANINANESLLSNSTARLIAAKDLNLTANKDLKLIGNTLQATSGSINVQSAEEAHLLQVDGATLYAGKDLNIYGTGDVSLKNLSFDLVNNATRLKDINVYSGKNLTWDNKAKPLAKISGKLQLEAKQGIELAGTALHAANGIVIQSDTLNLNTTVKSDQGIDLTTHNAMSLAQGTSLTAVKDVNLASLQGSIQAKSLKVNSTAGHASIIAHANVNLNSVQTTVAAPQADRDEQITDKTVINAAQGIVIASAEKGTVSVNSADLTSAKGDLKIFGQNGVNLDSNIDVVVGGGDNGYDATLSNQLKGQSVSIGTKKGNIDIKNTALVSTVDQLNLNSEAGMLTVNKSTLQSKGNTEIFAQQDLNLANGNMLNSEKHTALSSQGSVNINKASNTLKANGILSITSKDNIHIPTATLQGGSILLEAGKKIELPNASALTTVDSAFLKSDPTLKDINGRLTIQSNDSLAIDPKLHKINAYGDIELVSKHGTLTLLGYGGQAGNGSEKVVNLNTSTGEINLEGASIDIQGAHLTAQKNIQLVSTQSNLVIEGVKNNFSNQSSSLIYSRLLEEKNTLLSLQTKMLGQPYETEKQALENLKNTYNKALQRAYGDYNAVEHLYKPFEIKFKEFNKKYKDSVKEDWGWDEDTDIGYLVTKFTMPYQKELDELIPDLNFFKDPSNGYEHAESILTSNTGNIVIASKKGISISGGNISAKTGRVDIDAQGSLEQQYKSTVIKGVNGQATELGASIIIDGHTNFYDKGNETDLKYSMRTLLIPTIINGDRGVSVRATGKTQQDNLILQATAITATNGDVRIEANKRILFDAAIEQSYDRSTTTEKKKSWGGLKKKYITTVAESNNANAASVDIAGKNIFIETKELDKNVDKKNPDNNIDIYSGRFTSNGGQISIQSGGDINLYTVQESSSSNVDITTKSSFAGIKYNTSKTNSTRTQVTELPGVLKANYIGVKAANDIQLMGTEFEYLQDANIEAGGSLSLLTASNTITKTLERKKKSVVWQSMQDKGSIIETAQLPQFNGPVLPTFKAAGGLSVQIPISEKDQNKVELRDEILKLANQPGNAYLKELVNRKDVDWQTILLTQKDWDYKSQGLTGAGAAIIALIVAIATYGAGVAALGTTTVAASGGATTVTVGTTTVAVGAGGSATAFGSTVLATTTAAGVTTYTTTGLMINAALTSLASQTSVSLVNNQGDVAKTLKDLGSKDSVKNLATSVVTAGLLDKIGGTATMESLKMLGNTPDILMNLAAKTATAIIETTVKTGINSAITGESFSEGLDDLLYQSLGTAIQGTMANHIHLNKEIISDGLMKNILSQVAHATAGCAGGAIGGGECVAGAIGAAVGESVAEYMKQYSSDQKLITNISNAMAVTIAAASGYDTAIAQQASETAVTNNAFWVPLIAAVTIADRAYSAYQIYRDVQDIVDGKKSLEQLASEKGTAYVERAILGNLTSKGLGIVSEEGKKVIKRVTYIAPEKEITELFTKTNSRNTLTIAGLDIKKGYNPVNSQTTVILDSQKLTPDNIKAYAQQLAGTIPLKAVGNGDKQIYVATLSNGQQIRLRSVSSSASQTRARWTIDIQGNPGINNSLGLSSKEKVEIKFR